MVYTILFVDAEDEVARGCLSKKEFKDVDDVYKFKGQDDCKKENGSGMYCCFFILYSENTYTYVNSRTVV